MWMNIGRVPRLKHRIEELRREKLKHDGVNSAESDPMTEHDIMHIGINKEYMERAGSQVADHSNKNRLQEVRAQCVNHFAVPEQLS